MFGVGLHFSLNDLLAGRAIARGRHYHHGERETARRMIEDFSEREARKNP
jgi:predicted Kef-type K+ transport protein